MNSTDLLLDVNVLHVTQLCLALGVHSTIVAVNGSLLPARQLVLGKGLSGYGIENIAALAGKTLEVVGNINM